MAMTGPPQACTVVSWVRMVEREGRINLKTLPMVTEYFDQGTQTAQEASDEVGQGQGGISEELAELRERESAYKETIREADAILSKVEGGYVQKIAALETELTALRTKVRERIRTELVMFAKIPSYALIYKDQSYFLISNVLKISPFLDVACP